MTKTLRNRLLIAVLGLSACLTTLAVSANSYFGRQYYSTWYAYPQQSYSYYRYYYYQPYVDYVGYQAHVVCYYPQTYPGYYYYYNPYSNVYWGRAPIKSEKPQYSLLDPKDRKKDLADIAESAFPPPGDMPAIPGSKDNIKMELPPPDLPAAKVTGS